MALVKTRLILACKMWVLARRTCVLSFVRFSHRKSVGVANLKSWFDDRHPDRQTPVTYDTDFELVDSEEFFLIGQLFKSLISINIEQSKATYDEIVV